MVSPTDPRAQWVGLSQEGKGTVVSLGEDKRKAERVVMTEKIYACLLLLSSRIKDKRRLNT